MNVLLINPPYPISETPSPPLGLAYLAGALLAAGHRVQVLDLVVRPFRPDELAQILAFSRPGLVGVASVTMTFPAAADIVRQVKRLSPGCFTIMGGPHVTFRAAPEMRLLPELDAACLGEGEAALCELAQALEQGEDPAGVAGLVLRRGEKIVATPPRAQPQDVALLAKPARHLLPLGRYRALGMPISMTSSRGCPHRCIFCVGRKMVGSRVRYFPPERVVDELAELAGLGFKQINLADDLFTANRKHALAVCQGILDRGLQVKWSAFARVDTVDPELLRQMRRAGCQSISYGVESGDEGILAASRKGISLAQVERAVAMGVSAGLITMVSFILGLPGETEQTIKTSLAFAAKLKALGASHGFHVLAPFPGSEVAEKAGEYGLSILTRDWSQYHANRAVSQTAGAGKERIDAIVAGWEGDFLEWLGEVERLAKNGNAPPEDLAVLRGIEKAAGLYDLMMCDALAELGTWPDGGQGRETLLAELAARVGSKTTLKPAALAGCLDAALTDGSLLLRRENGRVSFSFPE